LTAARSTLKSSRRARTSPVKFAAQIAVDLGERLAGEEGEQPFDAP
jgi:hypothetical protein